MQDILVFPDLSDLAQAAASRVLEIGNNAIASRGAFTLVLSGGSTPLPVYRQLYQQSHALDWSKVHVFWGDERCLPPDDPQNNYRQAWDALLAHVSLPAENVHRIKGELPADQGAGDYQARLSGFFAEHPALTWQEVAGSRFPSFDLILLGMGDDGHTASLFPGSPALDAKIQWVVGVQHALPPPPLVDRVTLALPLINAAAHVIFLVSGESKAIRLGQVFADEIEPHLPAGRVRPASGQLEWMVDSSAARALPRGNS
jgi:6-phosphogluconolactonase